MWTNTSCWTQKQQETEAITTRWPGSPFNSRLERKLIMVPYQNQSLSLNKEQQWRLQLLKWPVEISRQQLREQYFWYRKSFVLLFCGVLLIAVFPRPSSRTHIGSRRLLDAENPEDAKFLNFTHPMDSIYTFQEQLDFLKILDASLSFDNETLEFLNRSYQSETSVTGNECDGSDTTWKGLKIPPQVFRFLFIPDCEVIRSDTLTLVYVFSRVTAFSHREQIRRTWASEDFTHRHNLSVIFVISLPNSSEIQKTTSIEYRMHRDILQVNIPETYDNLAFKSAASLAWISRCGRHVPTIMKADDDTIPNIILLQMMYKQKLQSDRSVRNLLYCKKLTQIKVKRTYNFMGKYKNIVTPEEFAADYLPPYCQGRVVFMTSDVALALFSVFLRTEIFRVDDAYMSGLLRTKTCINITGHYSYDTTFIEPLQWRGLFIDFSVFAATLYTKLGLDITVKTSSVDMPEDLMNEL